jgi:hypothetical protein
MTTPTEITVEIERLLSILPLARSSEYDKVMPAYLKVLTPYRIEYIREAVDKLIAGELKETMRKTAPRVPELAAIVREIQVGHAVEANRAERERQRALPAPSYVETSPGEKSRMALKMPMWSHAWPHKDRIARLAKANKEGLEAMVVLAVEWGVAIPPDLYEPSLNMAVARWRTAYNRIHAAMESNPPPYTRSASWAA